MDPRHLVIVGGGLAGMSAGCYALRSGFRVTIVEHNLALGGVCTAWQRGPYTVDGCIHWLTGGPFQRVYEELEILPAVPLRTLTSWMTYRDARDGLEVSIDADLDATFARLRALAPEDADELARMRDAVAEVAAMELPIAAPELTGLREGLRRLWHLRDAAGAVVHFRKSTGQWARERLRSPRLRQLLVRLVPETAPALFLLMVLGYLERGWLSRPVGGTAVFRDALERTYRGLGGQVVLHGTVDEILVAGDRVRGVRLADGELIDADVVVSTSSAPETVLRLLGGRYEADAVRDRMATWKMFDPIVLASFGVEGRFADQPPLMVIDGVPPFDAGGRTVDTLYLRIGNDEPAFAPPGHTVVQAMLTTDYAWWATRGTGYGAAKDAMGAAVLDHLEPHLPGLRAAVRMTDLATPLTYWNMARSWRGAFEGWMPTGDSMFGHIDKRLHGLAGFYQCGQWVEPGGGVPTAVLSGRQAIELACADDGRTFVPTRPM
ncbi:MAG: NAD(P)/FAD-dependent oxidoreductase [Kofleriaceae bacterium]|nr:NAD(P)/FAD-dependent oxidoreductase [Myxococcales bacterium]MCB9564436.1 NAD(P)/FAD-dependent oxidoreductase [Kofleriaceae bacterium]MCB9573859.1 NAD(P)/FAD-dependent oxidoreductase [Kofleriaceae bacterium]